MTSYVARTNEWGSDCCRAGADEFDMTSYVARTNDERKT